MKNKILILLIAALFFAESCSDSYLQEDYSPAFLIPIDANTIKTNDDLQNSIRGLYASLSSRSGFGGDYFTYQELSGDIGFVSLKNSGYFVSTNAENHLIVDGGASGGIWEAFYNTIANANFILSYDGKVPDDPKGEFAKSETLFAHARVIRAYNYLALLGLFSPNYGEGDQSLGVPYPEKYDIEAKLPRLTVDTVINNIITDLKAALVQFENDSKSAIYNQNKSFNVNAINLLLARAYLFKKDYSKAQQYAELVIDNTKLLNKTTFPQIFLPTGEGLDEILFQIDFTQQGDSPSNGITNYWSIVGNYKQNFMAFDFYKSFYSSQNGTTSTDIRLTSSSWYQNNVTSYPDTPKPISVRKYLNGFRDVIQLRRTEAVFIKAECQYHTNPDVAFQTLKSWVTQYRDSAYNKSFTGTAVLDEILRQKGLEFFLEGMRFTDLKRNNKPVVKYQFPTVSIPVGDKRFIWPIPLKEIQNNPNITQAPGY